MPDQITGKVAVVVANEGIEQIELTESWRALKEAGARPTLIAPAGGWAQAMNHLDKAPRRSRIHAYPTSRTRPAGSRENLVPNSPPTPDRTSQSHSASSREACRSRSW